VTISDGLEPTTRWPSKRGSVHNRPNLSKIYAKCIMQFSTV